MLELLSFFEGAREQILSGDTLAQQLGISRVSVFNRLEKLRALGFIFEAITGKGYRLTGVPDKICAPWLTVLAQKLGVKMSLKVLESTGSTNTEATQALASGAQCAPFVIFSNKQTAGRGRIGRVWDSTHAGNIYASFAFAPKIQPAKMANFTPWMGVSICAMLEKNYAIPAKVKWPNDIFCGGKKLAGILTEVHMDTDSVHGVVLGIGLNVQRPPESLPEELRAIATALCENTPHVPIDVNAVAAQLMKTIETAANLFFEGLYSDQFPKLWERYDLLAGKAVTAVYGNEEIVGTAEGVDLQGRIRIRLKDQSLLAFSAGDVLLKK